MLTRSKAGNKFWVKRTDTRAVSVGVAHRTALSGNTRCSVGTREDGPAEGGHQLWAESGPHSSPIDEGLPSL